MSKMNGMFSKGTEERKNESVEKKVLWFLIECHERVLEALELNTSNNLDCVSDVTAIIFSIINFELDGSIQELEPELEEFVEIQGTTNKVTYETVKKIYMSTKVKYRIYSEIHIVNSFLMLFHVFRLRFDELTQSRETLKSFVEDLGLSEVHIPLLSGFSFSPEVKILCKEYLGPLTVAVCLANSSEEDSSFWFDEFRHAYWFMPGATLMANSLTEGEEKHVMTLLATFGIAETKFRACLPMCLVLNVCRQSRHYLSWLGGGMKTSLDCHKVPPEVGNLSSSGAGVSEVWTAAAALSTYQISVPSGTTKKIAAQLVHHASLGPHQSPYLTQSLPPNLEFSSRELINISLLDGISNQTSLLDQSNTDISNEETETETEDYDDEIFQMDDI